MRDIRGDLQDRATLFEKQINAAQAQLEKLIEQLKREQDSRLEYLKAELDAVNTLMEVEHRRLGSAPSAPKAQPQMQQPQPQRQPQPQQAQPQTQPKQPRPQQPQPQPQQRLADFLIRKLSEVGAMSRDDLRHSTVQEGYFADGDSAERGVHETLMHVVKAGLIRQLPNGNFASPTVMDTIRLRRVN
jgi:hypothetical protein